MTSPRADKIIKNHVIMSLGVAAIPVPMLDLFFIYYIQSDMLKQLSMHYNKNYFGMEGKAFISALTSVGVARLAASFVKGIPGVGSFVGGATSVALSGASTYALGKVAAHFFYNDLELSDINMDLAKSLFEQELKKGKEFAQKIVDQREEKMNNMTTEESIRQEELEKAIYEKLITLKKMRDDNLITEEEYQKKRIEFMKQLDFLDLD